ncbi:MAG TPA: hypothetical protein PK109_02320, partial [Candidatus Paceibacterota bacterium]|nr:hypothetical protein [Candidatus Paceibacterota bacterium]
MKRTPASKAHISIVGGAVLVLAGAFMVPHLAATTYDRGSDEKNFVEKVAEHIKEEPKLDTEAYDKKMRFLAHVDETATTSTSTPKGLWPVTDAPYPKAGALLPFNRIVAYYGNFYSTKMGVLGEYDKGTVLAKLKSEKAAWEAADPTTPVVMGIDYIAVTAQGSPQADGTYKLRMPEEHIQRAIDMANEVDGIVILEIQVGLSTFQKEIPLLDKYLALPNVHLAIDPEFSMKGGEPPGDVIGTVSSADVNYAAQYLADLVREHDLPPKLLVIHRFTQKMVTGAANIEPLPEVQMVMVMDGWGFGAKKINTYNSIIKPEPVQF